MKKLWLIVLVVMLAGAGNASADLYDIDSIATIEITFSQPNWDYLLDSLYADGDEERLVGSAVINGRVFDSVGVRYKGSSTYSPDQVKNPLNIKLDHIIDDQTYDNYGTLKLANVWSDPSFVREVLSYEIARKYMPAGRANFIRVFINGAYIGLYSNVQSVDSYFLKSHYYGKDNAFFKGDLLNESPSMPVTVWGYLGEDSTAYMPYYEMKSDSGWSELIAFLDVFNNDTAMIPSVLNVDRHLWMLAFDNVLVNLDAPINFGHNFYLYKDGAGQFNPIVWDFNQSLGSFDVLVSTFTELSLTEMQQLEPLLHLGEPLYPIIGQVLSKARYRKMYLAHMKTIIAENLANGWFDSRAAELQALVDAEVQLDPNKFYSYSDFVQNLAGTVGLGARQVVGVTELMDGRYTHLSTLPLLQTSPPLMGTPTHTPTMVSPGETVLITATANGADSIWLAYRETIGGAFVFVPMYDDGVHGDGAGGDEIYGVYLTATGGEIQYYLYAENSDAGVFSPPRAAYEYYVLPAAAAGDFPIVINEFMADNETTIEDPDEPGEFADWVELYNRADTSVTIGGMYLTDDYSNPTQWQIPDGITVAPHGYVLFWADGDPEQGVYHADFKLSASGESLMLSDTDDNGNAVRDSVTFGAQVADVSTGRLPDAGSGWQALTSPSPGATNGSATDVGDNDELLPTQVSLGQNYPNPFNPTTTIEFSLSQSEYVSMSIHNVLGERVKTLVSRVLPAGSYSVVWDGTDSGGRGVASGTYFYRLTTPSNTLSYKMMLVK